MGATGFQRKRRLAQVKKTVRVKPKVDDDVVDDDVVDDDVVDDEGWEENFSSMSREALVGYIEENALDIKPGNKGVKRLVREIKSALS